MPQFNDDAAVDATLPDVAPDAAPDVPCPQSSIDQGGDRPTCRRPDEATPDVVEAGVDAPRWRRGGDGRRARRARRGIAGGAAPVVDRDDQRDAPRAARLRDRLHRQHRPRHPRGRSPLAPLRRARRAPARHGRALRRRGRHDRPGVRQPHPAHGRARPGALLRRPQPPRLPRVAAPLRTAGWGLRRPRRHRPHRGRHLPAEPRVLLRPPRRRHAPPPRVPPQRQRPTLPLPPHHPLGRHDPLRPGRHPTERLPGPLGERVAERPRPPPRRPHHLRRGPARLRVHPGQPRLLGAGGPRRPHARRGVSGDAHHRPADDDPRGGRRRARQRPRRLPDLQRARLAVRHLRAGRPRPHRARHPRRLRQREHPRAPGRVDRPRSRRRVVPPPAGREPGAGAALPHRRRDARRHHRGGGAVDVGVLPRAADGPRRGRSRPTRAATAWCSSTSRPAAATG